MSPPRFKTAAGPIQKRKSTKARELCDKEFGGVATLWMAALYDAPSRIATRTGTDTLECQVWRYRNTLLEGNDD